MGLFDTEREAIDASRWQQLDQPTKAVETMREANLAELTEACAAAGVQVGEYDGRILRWLADMEPQMCAVVAGLITRAAVGAGGLGSLTPAELVARLAPQATEGRAEDVPDEITFGRLTNVLAERRPIRELL